MQSVEMRAGAAASTWERPVPVELGAVNPRTIRRWLALAAFFGLTVGGYVLFFAGVSHLVGS